MVRLNFSDLSSEAQERLLEQSKKQIESRFGQDILRYAQEQQLDYQELLEEEAIRNLYSYSFVFSV